MKRSRPNHSTIYPAHVSLGIVALFTDNVNYIFVEKIKNNNPFRFTEVVNAVVIK